MSWSRAIEVLLLALLAALATWFAGWWAVPLLTAVWQVARPTVPSWLAGAAGSVGWLGFLLMLPPAPLARLTARLSGIFHLPPGGALILCLGFVFLLGWSAARVVRPLRSQ